MSEVLGDFLRGLKAPAREPAFALAATGVLALGFGAVAAMSALVDAVFLKRLPFADSERIARVWQAPRPGVVNATSTLDFLDWKRLGTSFEALAAERPAASALTGEGEPVRLVGKAVTSDYFRVFAADFALGRGFQPDDEEPGAAPVVVLGYAAWRDLFGADPDILNRRPILDGVPRRVIGVTAPGPFDREATKFWTPLVFTPDQVTRDFHWLTVHGRLGAGASFELAREQMRAIDAATKDSRPAFKRDWVVAVEPLENVLTGDGLRRSVLVAFGAVLMVLLIACANVANLLLSKGVARRKELAVRAALGASRGRLIAQLLAESAALCVVGGAASVALAAFLLRAASPLLAETMPAAVEVALDWRVLAFVAALVAGVVPLVGVLPAVGAGAADLSRSLNQSSRGASGSFARVRGAIVVAEVGVSLTLVCGAFLLLRSLDKLQDLNPGARIENILTMSVDLPADRYPTPSSAERFYRAVAERLEAAPGVDRAALATELPLRWISNGEGLRVAGVEEPLNVRFKRVDPGYFDALDIPLLAGRGIAREDRPGAPSVVVINEALAGRLADAAGVLDPVGTRVRISTPAYGAPGFSEPEYTVVGVIRSERAAPPGRPDPAVAYVPLAQAPRSAVKVLTRTRAAPAAVMSAIREAVGGVDRDLPLGDVATMRRVRERSLAFASRPAWVVGAFAAAAAMLAVFGLYGVLAELVTRRRREIGVRMALGASSREVSARVLRDASKTIAIGLALGLVGTFALTRVVKNLLFEVSPLDPVALGAACAGVAAVGLLAAAIPARRAARVDPIEALRDED